MVNRKEYDVIIETTELSLKRGWQIFWLTPIQYAYPCQKYVAICTFVTLE